MSPIRRFLKNIISRISTTRLPYDAEFYVKRQQDTRSPDISRRIPTPPDFITNADRQQEQFDVARLPEITYQRIGDSFADDQLTLYSNNSGAALKFDQQHFLPRRAGFYPGLSPGLPSDGITGTTGNIVFRGDTRQEVDWPFAIGRTQDSSPTSWAEATSYSDSPGGDGQNRLFGGVGLRITTTFWHVDDSIDSDLFDLHRIRHVIQPEVNLFTSAPPSIRASFIFSTPTSMRSTTSPPPNLPCINTGKPCAAAPAAGKASIFSTSMSKEISTTHQPSAVGAQSQFHSAGCSSRPSRKHPSPARRSIPTSPGTSATTPLSFPTCNGISTQRETAIAEGGLAINRGRRLSYYVGDAYIQDLESADLQLQRQLQSDRPSTGEHQPGPEFRAVPRRRDVPDA